MSFYVSFFFAGDIPRSIAERMLKSVRETMPNVPIVHQTDAETKAFDGCEVIRLPWSEKRDVAELFWRHMAQAKGDFIKLDYDCVVMQSLRGVMTQEFQAGLTIRDDRDVSLSNTFRLRHPHNAGVMFSKGEHTFWREVYEAYMAIPDRDGWMDACDALETAVANTKAKIQDFPAFLYNFTPISPYERLNGKFVVHYKGKRKHWHGGSDMDEMEAGLEVEKKVQLWKRLGRFAEQVTDGE